MVRFFYFYCFGLWNFQIGLDLMIAGLGARPSSVPSRKPFQSSKLWKGSQRGHGGRSPKRVTEGSTKERKNFKTTPVAEEHPVIPEVLPRKTTRFAQTVYL